jgi:3-hydroxyisobutyrate dehydrogenase
MKIGFIGLGMMGASFASNLQKAGFDLTVHDLSQQIASKHLEAGASWADTPKALAEQCDVVMTSLPGPLEVEKVAMDPAEGLLAGFAPGKVYFDLSTNAPTMIRKLHAEFLERGVHLLDAPVSGGPAGAASGKLAIWVGGDEAVFAANRESLDALGDQVRYIGPVGAGSVAKLVHNASGYAIQTALAEVFSVGIKAGVEPVALWEAVRQGARGRVRTFDSLADHFLINNYDPAKFALRLAHKDVALAAELGRDMGVPMRTVDLTLAEMTEALSRGWGDRDSRSSMLLQLERAGIDVDSDRDAIAAVFAADEA